MRRIETLNSVYEVDGNKIRRVSGVNEPTPSFSADGEWKAHQGIYPLPTGGVEIRWSLTTATYTSRVLSDEMV